MSSQEEGVSSQEEEDESLAEQPEEMDWDWISRFLVLQIFPNQIYVNINGILVLQNSILILLLKIAYNREDEIKLLTAKVSI